MKTWQVGGSGSKAVEKFTVGNDYVLDQELVSCDCDASIAHAKMLASIDVLSSDECETLIEGLETIKKLHADGEFAITQADEDCHTAIENYLTAEYGDVGKKIHTARSRNDQVLTALRLYEKDMLEQLEETITELISALQKKCEQHTGNAFPGYTHMQQAMPTTIDTWLGSFVSALQDDLVLLESVNKLIDQSPLGTAAGFGVPVLDVDRQMTASEMGFGKVQENPMYAQHSRGKFEAQILNVIVSVLFDLNKFASDVLLFTTSEFSLMQLPTSLCTGSSVMPQKKNYDVLELLRGKYSVALGEEMKIKNLIGNLMSGYNRDVQLSKEPVMNGLNIGLECVQIATLVVENLDVDVDACENAVSEQMHATAQAYKLVKDGMPFRDAYKQVAKKYRQ